MITNILKDSNYFIELQEEDLGEYRINVSWTNESFLLRFKNFGIQTNFGQPQMVTSDIDDRDALANALIDKICSYYQYPRHLVVNNKSTFIEPQNTDRYNKMMKLYKNLSTGLLKEDVKFAENNGLLESLKTLTNFYLFNE